MAQYQIKLASTAYPLVFLMVDSADHVTGKTGLTPTVTISKAGAAFSSPAGAVSEIANGWYKVAGNATDSGTLGALVLHATGTGADPTDVTYEVVAHDVQDAVHLGLTALPNAAAAASGGLLVYGIGTGAINPSGGKVPATIAAGDAATLEGYTDTLESLGATISAYVDTVESVLASILAKVTNLPSDPADASDIAATLATLAGYTDTLEASATSLAAAIALVQGYTDQVEGYTDTLETAVAALPTAASINTVLSSAHGSGPWGGASGSGAITWAYTLTSTVSPFPPIADAEVWVTTDSGGTNIVASGTTNASGVVTFYLDAGTYYVWRRKSGWNFTNPDTEVVA